MAPISTGVRPTLGEASRLVCGQSTALQVAVQGLSASVAESTDGATLEAFCISLLESAQKLAAMRRLSEAYQRDATS